MAQELGSYRYGFKLDREEGDAVEAAKAVAAATRWMTGERVGGEVYEAQVVRNDDTEAAGEFVVRVAVYKPSGQGRTAHLLS